MNVKYCCVCTTRIPEADFASGKAVEWNQRTYCAKHRPTELPLSDASPTAGQSDRRRGTSQRVMRVSVSERRPTTGGLTKPGTPATNTPAATSASGSITSQRRRSTASLPPPSGKSSRVVSGTSSSTGRPLLDAVAKPADSNTPLISDRDLNALRRPRSNHGLPLIFVFLGIAVLGVGALLLYMAVNTGNPQPRGTGATNANPNTNTNANAATNQAGATSHNTPPATNNANAANSNLPDPRRTACLELMARAQAALTKLTRHESNPSPTERVDEAGRWLIKLAEYDDLARSDSRGLTRDEATTFANLVNQWTEQRDTGYYDRLVAEIETYLKESRHVEAIGLVERVAEGRHEIMIPAKALAANRGLAARVRDLVGMIQTRGQPLAEQYFQQGSVLMNDAEQRLAAQDLVNANTQYRNAIANFDAAIKLNPERALAFSQRGLCKMRITDSDAGMADLSKALQIKATTDEVAVMYSNRGVGYGILSQHALAVADFEQAAKLAPENYMLWLNLAIGRLNVGDKAAGREALTKCLEIAPPTVKETLESRWLPVFKD